MPKCVFFHTRMVFSQSLSTEHLSLVNTSDYPYILSLELAFQFSCLQNNTPIQTDSKELLHDGPLKRVHAVSGNRNGLKLKPKSSVTFFLRPYSSASLAVRRVIFCLNLTERDIWEISSGHAVVGKLYTYFIIISL